ncbi:MAG: glycosyltransferase family 4 protein [Thermomicrobiales bacterium]
MTLRVLLQTRDDFRAVPGGDTVQAEHTAEELRALGVAVDLTGDLAPDLSAYDLVHVFNTFVIEEPFRQVVRARAWGLPVALSPIYHWNQDALRRLLYGAAAAGPAQSAFDRLLRARQQTVLGAAALILPNSRAEASAIARDFPGLPGLTRIVPNAVDGRFAAGDGARFCARHGLTPRGFVLCAGRKEHRKNQAALIRICAELGLPLVLVGYEPPAVHAYLAECRALAEASPVPVLFLPHLDPDDLADAYAAARVYAQPSYFETVGLASLEAALGGANIVTTADSGVAEYLDDAAWYCRASEPDSVRDAVAAAWAAPLRADLGPAIVARFTWRRAAEETLRGYEEVLRMPHDQQDTRWLPDLPPAEYIAHLENLVQLQLEATAFRDAQYDELLAGFEAEQAERQRVEAAYRELAANAAEQSAYLARLEAAQAARTPAPSLFDRLRKTRSKV